MKKVIYTLIVSLVVVSGLVFANHKIKSETSKKLIPKPLSMAERKAALKKWEATPDGIMFKKWEVYEYTDMEAVVTSLSLPPDARLGFGVMVMINGDDYILAFGIEKSDNSMLDFNNEFKQLHELKINDKIIIRSHSVSHAPKYSYPIVSGDYVEQNGKVIYKRAPRKGGC